MEGCRPCDPYPCTCNAYPNVQTVMGVAGSRKSERKAGHLFTLFRAPYANEWITCCTRVEFLTGEGLHKFETVLPSS